MGAGSIAAQSSTIPLHGSTGTLLGASHAQVHGLILGHLPVLAAAWVAPYARHAAETSKRTVGLVRVQAGQISIDVFTPSGMNAFEFEQLAHAGLDLSSTLRSLKAIKSSSAGERGGVGLWLFRVDDASEADLAQSPHVSALTLLTGADDAAVVASYRTLKGLAGVLQSSDRPDPTACEVRVAVMGADRARAESAEARLRKASSTFLGVQLPPFDRIDKIGPARGICVHRGPCPIAMQDLGTLIGSLGEIPAGSNPHAGAHSSQTTVEVKPLRSLAGYISGLTTIETVCPYAHGVELAHGADGLHLLISADTVPVSEAVQLLLTASAWAEDHLGLLAAAHPGLAGTRPIMHLFTDEPKSARGVLHTSVRVHLLAATASGRDWVCRDLN